MSTKLTNTSDIQHLLKNAKKQGHRVGIITGSFVAIVENHILLFEFAKTYVDILIVCVGNDFVVSCIKNTQFPTFKERVERLSKYEQINYIYEIRNINKNADNPVIDVYKDLIKELNPDFIFTNSAYDKYIPEKEAATLNTSTEVIDRKSVNALN